MSKNLPAVFLVTLLTVGGVCSQQGDRRSSRSQSRSDQDRPLFITGQVITENSIPLPQPLKIVLLCSGAVAKEVHTDNDGRYTLQLGGATLNEVQGAETGALEQVTAGTNETRRSSRVLPENIGVGSASRSRVNLAGCTLRAVAAGFTSSEIQLGVRRVLDEPEVGTITIRPGAETEGSLVSVNTLAAPPEATRAFNDALKLLSGPRKNIKRAIKRLEHAVSVYPQFSEAWRLMARTRLAREDTAGAQRAFEKSIEADPLATQSRLELAQLFADQKRWEESARTASSGLDQSPSSAGLLYAHSLANFNLGNLEVSQKSALRLKESGQAESFPGVFFLLGAILASNGQISEASVELEQFLVLSPEAPAAERVRQQLELWKQQGLLKPG